MEAQHELAFRTLQSGLNIGKVVVRIARRSHASGAHFVTGGTGGLGLLTARWLAQRGARSLALASRSGALARLCTMNAQSAKALSLARHVLGGTSAMRITYKREKSSTCSGKSCR